MNPVGRKVLQIYSCRIGQEQWEVVDNETVTIRSTDLESKPVILEPYSGVRFPRVFWDVGQRSVPWWEGGAEDVLAEYLRSRQVGAQALVLAVVVASVMTRVVAIAGFLSLVASSTPTGIQGVTSVTVEVETLMHWDHGALLAALWHLVD